MNKALRKLDKAARASKTCAQAQAVQQDIDHLSGEALLGQSAEMRRQAVRGFQHGQEHAAQQTDLRWAYLACGLRLRKSFL